MTNPARAAGHPWYNLPLYPFLVGALPAVHFYEANFRILPAHDLLRPILLAALLVGLILAAGRLIWHSSAASAVVFTPLLAVIFKGSDLGGPLSLALLLLSIVGGLFLKRRPGRWPEQLGLPLNVALLILVLLPLINVWRVTGHQDTPTPSSFFAADIRLPAQPPARARPDIYYLMVDALGQPDFLEDRYPLQKSAYSDLFTSRGFQVLRRSFANYPQTALSTAATLNLGAMDQILDISDPASKDRRVLVDVVGHSRTVRALKKLGYQVVSFPSGYPLTRQALADHRRQPFLDPSFAEYYLLEDGVLPLVLPLLGHGPADLSYGLRRGRLNYIFNNLPSARDGVADNDPVFVYAHILAPHPPFVFGREGQALRSRATFAFADGDHWLNIHGRQDHSYRQHYADQAVWVMKRLAAAVDGIIASSPRPKIIIIQGDHGPGSGLKWEQPLATDHDERFGIFNAWYVSGGQQLPLYEGMTAYNTFPLLFDTFFGAHLVRLPDEHWFARMSRPYTYFPVGQ